MEKTLAVINELEKEGVIGKYAIGGAIGAMYYSEAQATEDLDIFCLLPRERILYTLSPVYEALKKRGHLPNEAEQIEIEGIPVQFLIPPSALEEEALNEAIEDEVFGVKTRFFSYEHLLAIMVKTGRAKDKARIYVCLNSSKPDEKRLRDILERYNLAAKWTKIIENED